jgi:hypothetical protein
MKKELDAQLKAIGKIVVAFNILDVKINNFISWLIGDNLGVGQLLTAQINSFQIRVNILFTLYKYRTSRLDWFQKPSQGNTLDIRNELVNEMHELKTRMENINRKRNQVIHSYWFQQQRHFEEYGEAAPITGLDIRAERYKKIEGGKVGMKYDVISMTSEELEQFEGEIITLANDLETFQTRTVGIEKT